MSGNKHPLAEYANDAKVAYISVVASMASADGDVDDDEISALRKLCKQVELSSDGIGIVIAAAENPDSVAILDYIEILSQSELRFTLLTDVVFMAHADGNVDEKEDSRIDKIASLLSIKPEQTEAIRDYVKAVIKASNSNDSTESLKKLGGDVSASLVSAGVPIGAVAVSGSVYGLSAAGITSGLAALGMGLGMTTGIGVVAAIGIGAYFGTRWLYKKAVGA